MAIGSLSQVGSVKQNSRFPAVGFLPAAPKKQSGTTSRKGSVDLVGFPSVTRVFELLKQKEALPIPKAVEHAIQTLAKEVLDGLPKGPKPFIFS